MYKLLWITKNHFPYCFLSVHIHPRSEANETKDKKEPRHDKTNKMACVPSKDSDQPGHRPV